MKTLLLLLVIVLSAPAVGSAEGSETAIVKVAGDKAMLVGFFPPVTQADIDDDKSGASEGIAHVRFALEDTIKCLEESGVQVEAELVLATELVLDAGARTTRFKIHQFWPQSVGIYMLAPGFQPEVVYGEAGPSSLIELAPEAAGKYFGARACGN